ncbi:MAG: hypothetical protein KKA32_06905 [Actinobacteria bacterium]|nr:hypothetical protein [Actinomycetota bacterium]
METQITPPSVEAIVKALRPILTKGLPVRPEFGDETLLGLRGVVARSVDPSDRLNRVKALDGLIRNQLVYYPDDELSEAARVLFGLAPGSRGKNLTARRFQAASETGYETDHFRKHIEPKILKMLAWQLHQDSQNYIPRSRAVPPPLESSGDTPVITKGDVSSKEAAEHEELLSRLWAHVYALRAEILRVERLKGWPYDATEPSLSEKMLEEAVAVRDSEVREVKVLVQRYIDTYGQGITHGEAEFNAEGLLRLAGWNRDI